jgi:hypothetical protein
MPVNNIFSQAASQEMSVALTEGAIQFMPEIERKESKEKIDKSERSITQQLLEEKGGNVSKQILTDLASKIAATGIKLNPESLTLKAQQGVKDEYDLMLRGAEERSDSVSIRTSYDAVKALQQQGQQQGGGQQQSEGQGLPLDSDGVKADIQEYAQVYSQFVVTGGSELKKKVEQLESRLRAAGLSVSDIQSFQNRVKLSLRGSIAGQIKESLLKRIMSQPKSMDWILATRELQQAIDYPVYNDRLGSFSFGGYGENLQGVVDQKTAEAKNEIRDFVKEELERNFISKKVGHEQAGKDIQELVKVGKRLGFDFNRFFTEWHEKKFDLGFQPVPYLGPNLNAGTSTGQEQGQKEQTGYEYSQADEQEILINQLRALYMQRAIKGDWRTKMLTAFKINKLKNGLIKLGINFGDFEKVEQDGLAMARLRTMDMLREALNERATLYELAGPAKVLLEKRIKGIMKNLERLGITLSADEFNRIRDDANRQMFGVTQEELSQVGMLRQTNANPYLEKRERLLVKLLERLNDETGIVDNPQIPQLSLLKEAA